MRRDLYGKEENMRKTTEFQERVYSICSKIPKGKVCTYGDIANALNSRAYQAVGSALNKNPYAPKVPCHRVVNADGSLGGFAYGSAAKKKILMSEGIKFDGDRVKDFESVRCVF